MTSNVTARACAGHIDALLSRVSPKRRFRITSLWDLKVPPSWRRPVSEPFRGADLRLHLVRGGRGRYQVDGQWIPMAKGLLMFFHPPFLFAHEADPADPPSLVSCHFDLADAATGRAVRSPAPPFFWTCQLGAGDYARMLPFFEHLSLLHREGAGRRFVPELQSAALYQLLGLVQHACLSLAEGSADPRIEAARLAIERNPLDRRRFLALPAEARLGKDYFAKLFRRQVGLSPKGYWLKSRMEYARFLLVHGSGVKAVATELGYSDPFVFSRLFKKVHGVTPSSLKFEPPRRSSAHRV